jgi:electron transport complex protein RnfB
MTELIAFALIMSLAGLSLLASRIAARSADANTRTQLIDSIDDLLPQTQCRRCTFEGCRPYATALADGAADINQCPPGGDDTATALAALLGRPFKRVDARFGQMPSTPMVAWIDEPACIGCTKCIQACPVDAIVGASRHMHTVIAADCTGCELCIPPCPVDCIVMVPAAASITDVIRRGPEPERLAS